MSIDSKLDQSSRSTVVVGIDPDQPLQRHRFATIESITEESAVVRAGDVLLPVIGINTPFPGLVPALRPGDRVKIAETEEGAWIEGFGTLMSEYKNALRVSLSEDGMPVFESPKGMLFKSNKAVLALTPDGAVMLNGTYVASISEGDNVIRGLPIRLN